MTAFAKEVKEHLGRYKQVKFGNIGDGKYNYRGREILMEHILPESMADKNIIEPYDSDMNSSGYLKSIKRHKYFHHLNSSQAMCINFFYPLIKEKQLDCILRALHIQGYVDYSTAKFEKESEVESGKDRRTSFDFYFETNEKIRVLFEIKYTENDFGKAENNDKHKDKFARTYAPVLNNSEAIAEAFKNPEIFFDNYQIMRNLIHINKDSYVIFIYPQRNRVIANAVQDIKKDMLKPDWNNHFIPYTWEEIIGFVVSNIENEELKKYFINDFCEKYLDI